MPRDQQVHATCMCVEGNSERQGNREWGWLPSDSVDPTGSRGCLVEWCLSRVLEKSGTEPYGHGGNLWAEDSI